MSCRATSSLGCELAQGYHSFRPQPPEMLEERLLEGHAASAATVLAR